HNTISFPYTTLFRSGYLTRTITEFPRAPAGATSNKQAVMGERAALTSVRTDASCSSLVSPHPSPLLRLEPRSYPALQHIERQGPAEQNDVVKLAHVESFAKRSFGPFAQRAQTQLPDLVCKCLTGPGDVALELRLNVVRRQGGVVGETAARLFDSPA